jgi:hypothetical protein
MRNKTEFLGDEKEEVGLKEDKEGKVWAQQKKLRKEQSKKIFETEKTSAFLPD